MGQQGKPEKPGEEEKPGEKAGRTGKTAYRILAVACVLVMVGSLGWLAKYLLDLKRSNELLEEMREGYISVQAVDMSDIGSGESAGAGRDDAGTEGKDAEDPAGAGSGEAGGEEISGETPQLTEEEREALAGQYGIPEKEIDFAALQAEQNPDIYAWITVPGTKIDYPVLQHPEEMDYYLKYNIDGSEGYPGCIYSQLMNSKDFTDPHTVLYGHNMKDGSMFANLHYYEDSEFFEEHPYIYIYTEEGTLVYQVFAAYEFSYAHLLYAFDLSREEGWEYYVESIYGLDGLRDQFNEELKDGLGLDSHILTLSTCIGGKADRRWLVSAVLMAEVPKQ